MNKGNKKTALVVIAVLALFVWIGYTKEKNGSERERYTPSNYSSNYSTNWSTPYNPAFDFSYGTTSYDFFDSGSSYQETTRKEICPVCHGSGSCQICNGKGWTSGYGDNFACSYCDDYSGGIDDNGKPYGNGRCSTCHGTGFY